jgi:hypothetical protein
MRDDAIAAIAIDLFSTSRREFIETPNHFMQANCCGKQQNARCRLFAIVRHYSSEPELK